MSKTFTRILAIIGFLVVLAILIVLRLDLFGDDKPEVTADAKSTPQPVVVQVVKPVPLSQEISVTGSVVANENVELRSEASGKITGIYFEEGSRVHRGKLLVKINDADLQAQLKKLEHQWKLAKDNESRQKQLLAKGGISQESYERTLTEVNALEAERELIQSGVAKTSIRAPFAGVIGLRHVSEGSYLSPSSPVADLVDTDPVKVVFSVPERYAGAVHTGDSIAFHLKSTGKTYKGAIYAKEPMIDEATRTLALKARAPNPDGEILPGSYADIQIALKHYEEALMVPTEAVIPELGGQKVMAYQGGQATPVTVETGIRQRENIQVTEGLQSGDTIIVSGLMQVRPGMTVEIKEVVQ